MAANLVRDESAESLQPRSESDSYASNEEKTDSGLVPTPDNTTDTSISTSGTPSMQSVDLQSPEQHESAKPSDGSSEIVTPTGKSFLSRAKDLAARVAHNFSPKKHSAAKDDDTMGPAEVAEESESPEPNEKTTLKKSLIKKCMDKILSPKKTCNLDTSKPSESMNAPTPESASTGDSESSEALQSDGQKKSRFAGLIDLRPTQEQNDLNKPEEAKETNFTEKSEVSVSSLEEAVFGAAESSIPEASDLVTEKTPESLIPVEEQAPESLVPEASVLVKENTSESSVPVAKQDPKQMECSENTKTDKNC